MKKGILLFLVLLCFCGKIFAAPFTELVFFGDSLSDSGNLYNLLLGIIPKSPPYFKGRFSNGETWAEHVGKYFYNQYYIDYKIYAVGGATAIYHAPIPKFIAPATLELELDKYLVDALFQNKSHILYTLWIGANDYLFDESSDYDNATTKVVDKISWAVNSLIKLGATKFLLLNLPDLSRTPYAVENGAVARLHAFTQLHNKKLYEAVQKIKHDNPQVTITFIDIYKLFNEVMDNPDVYNKKYNVNIINTTEACWQGGFFLHKDKIALSQKLMADLQRVSKQPGQRRFSEEEMANIHQYILNSPALLEAYRLNDAYQRGLMPCSNSSEYLFWDHIHPSQTVHRVLSLVITQELEPQLLT